MSECDASGKRIRKRSRKKSAKDRECKLPEKKNKKDADKLMTEETAEVGNVRNQNVFCSFESNTTLTVCNGSRVNCLKIPKRTTELL